jgi:hypothetical protein
MLLVVGNGLLTLLSFLIFFGHNPFVFRLKELSLLPRRAEGIFQVHESKR